MTAVDEPRRYRLPPLVHSGLFGALSNAQVVILGIGGAAAFGAVLAELIPVAAAAVAAAAMVAFKRQDGWFLHQVIGFKVGWLFRRWRGELDWVRPVPLLGVAGRAPVELPPVMAGLGLYEAEAAWLAASRSAGMAVVHDTAANVVTASVRVSGDGQFALAGPAERDARVEAWGEITAGFCRDNAVVAQVVWQEWTTVGDGDDQAELLAAMGPNEVAADARENYVSLLGRVKPVATRHETLVSLSVDVTKVRVRRRQNSNPLATAIETLVDEMRLFVHSIDGAPGMQAHEVLTPPALAAAVRTRSDPTLIPNVDSLSRSLAAEVGVGAVDFGPMAVSDQWSEVRVDGSMHRSYWIQGYPRRPVRADWATPLLVGVTATKTLTVVFEPISPTEAEASIDAAATSLDADAASKAKQRFRAKAADQRKRTEIELREQELVDGHGYLAAVGLVTLTASDPDALDDLTADYQAVAGKAGVQLRSLDSRHAQGWVASLPLGRHVAERRTGTA
jgi:hypothetical protein